MGWLFDEEQTPQHKYAPDLMKDSDIVRVSRMFPLLGRYLPAAPAVLGGLITWSWPGALTAFFWGSLVRVGLLHHVTWSINSICHAVGDRPFSSRDKSGNVWWLAIPSLRRVLAQPAPRRPDLRAARRRCGARSTSRPGSIWIFEKLGWAYDVRWPVPERIAAKRVSLT